MEMELHNDTCDNSNFTRNSSFCSSEKEHEWFTVYARARIIIYIVTFILSLLGNGCVILVTLRKLGTRQTVTAFKLLITHLAFVDFLFSCNIFVLIPNELYNAEANDRLPLCIFKRFLRQVPLEVSIGTIVIIAVERYRGITTDFRARKWTLKRVFMSLLIVWVLSFAVYMPSTFSIRTTRGDIDCAEHMSKMSRKLHTVFLMLAEYIVPLSIVSFCNYKIVKVLRNRRRDVILANEDEQHDAEQRKTIRILTAIVIGFAIIALPNQVFFAYLDFGDNHQIFSVTWDVLQLIGILLLVHSLFNPVIYSVMDEKFRNDAKELCCCFCLKLLPRLRTNTLTTTPGSPHSHDPHAGRNLAPAVV